MRLGRRLLALTGLAMALAPRSAWAQDVNFGALEVERPNLVQARGGAEFAFVAGLGYARVLPVGRRPLVLSADATLPVAHPGGGDYRARLSVQIPAVDRRRWRLAPRLGPAVRGTKTDFNRLTSISLDTSVVGGYYAPRWFVAGELGADTVLGTHIEHSASYRNSVYEDAVDGWYRSTGAHFYYGGLAGFSTRRVDIIARVGQSRNFVDGRTGLLPLYATVGVNVRF